LVDRRILTPEIVDALTPPDQGEKWVADAAVKGFGVRLWYNAKGDGVRYAIRVRDEDGVVRRENFEPWSVWSARQKISALLNEGIWEFEWGTLLDEARGWAKSRICDLKGLHRERESIYRRRLQLSVAFQSLTLEEMAERTLTRMTRQKRKDEYVDQVRKLFWRLSEQCRDRKMMEIDVSVLANDITHPSIRPTQSRVLQAFLGQLYGVLYRYHGPAGKIADLLNEKIATLRSQQDVPHPAILEIADSEFYKFLSILATEKQQWRQALAIALYFETGAKMRRVLNMRWSEVIDNRWYPYAPEEREYWFMGAEHLNEKAHEILNQARFRLEQENRSSVFVFPRIDVSTNRPINSVRRYWRRVSNEMGWNGLPLSHVVRRYNSRNTPSYTYMYSYLFVPMQRRLTDPDIVSKLTNRQQLSR
jgi:integrase